MAGGAFKDECEDKCQRKRSRISPEFLSSTHKIHANLLRDVVREFQSLMVTTARALPLGIGTEDECA